MSELKSNADAAPCLAAVMPPSNEATTIAEAVAVVLAQRPVQELVMVDDCSTDGTWDKVQARVYEVGISCYGRTYAEGKKPAGATAFARCGAW